MVFGNEFNKASEQARLEFLKTVERGGEFFAIIGDRATLGDQGLRDYKNALAAGKAPLARNGIHVMSQEQLKERLLYLSGEKNIDISLKAFERGIECIEKKATSGNLQFKNNTRPLSNSM